MKSGIEDQPSGPAESRPDGTAERAPRALLDAVSKRAEHAEAKALALETENRRLRSERTQTVLAAAATEAATPETASRSAEHAEAKALALAAENQRLRFERAGSALAAAQAEPDSSETAIRRAELAEARALALEAENKQLRAERAKAIVAAARAEDALKETRLSSMDESGQSPGSPPAELQNDGAALRIAAFEREAAVRTIEASMRQELAGRIDAMRHSHAAELEARSHEAKTRFAEELMSAMSAADMAWRNDAAERLRQAREKAKAALARAEAAWRLRSRLALLRAALVWRARERQRLAGARQRWEAMHRDAIDACNRRWQVKLDRLKATARRSSRRPNIRPDWRPKWRLLAWRPRAWRPKAWRPEAWRAGMARAFAFAKLDPPSERRVVGAPAPGQARIADAGFVAAALVFMALYLPPTAPFSTADAEPMAAAAAQAKTATQVANIRPDIAGHGLAADGHRNAPAKAKRDANAAPLQAPAKSAAGPAGNGQEAQATERELRLRLMEKIQRLRTEIAPR